MHYLIDGHNLIAQMKDISLDDPNDEILLVLRLRSWVAGSRKRQVTVIFDGGLPGGRSRLHSSKQLKVIFASEGRAADSLLIRRIQKAKNPAEFTLISNDQQIIDAARTRRMRHLAADDFARQLDELAQNEASAAAPVAPGESDEPAVSQEEVDEWLALFDAAPKVRRETPKPQPRQQQTKKAGDAKRARRPAAPRQNVDPAILKRGEDELSDDEVDDWLKLFGNEE